MTEVERLVCYSVPPPPSSVIDIDASLARGEPLAQVRGRGGGRARRGHADRTEQGRRASAMRPREALADDIERYLDGRPILARRSLGTSSCGHVSDGACSCSETSRRVREFAAMGGARGASRSRWWPPGPTAFRTRRHDTFDARQADSIDSIAVLPLANSAGDPNLDYLSEGIAEHVITRLSNTPRLRVIARDSAFRYRARRSIRRRSATISAYAPVLEGTIAQRDQVLSVSARLIDTRNGRQVWQDRYERGVTDLQQLQTELAQDIAGSLRLRLSDAEQARFAVRYTPSAEAYQLYLKGRYFWNRRTPADLQKSISYFQRATELDTQFALAFSGLADSNGVLTEYHAADATRHLHARAAARPTGRSRSIHSWRRPTPRWRTSGSSTSGISRAPSVSSGGRSSSIRATPRRISGSPSTSRRSGRFDEAIAEIRLAAALDPLSLIVNSSQAYILYMARRYDESIEQCRRVLDMEPNFPGSRGLSQARLRPEGHVQGISADAAAAPTDSRTGNRETPALRAAAAATTPREYWRRRVEQELIESRAEGLLPFEFAELLAQAGEHDRALEWLEKACAQHDFMSMYIRVTPNLDPVRSDPRYLAILQRSCAVTEEVALRTTKQ